MLPCEGVVRVCIVGRVIDESVFGPCVDVIVVAVVVNVGVSSSIVIMESA